MATTSTRPDTERRVQGRGAFWAGLGVFVAGFGLMALQYLVLKQLFVPWYVPALTTLAALLLLKAAVQRPNIVRIVVFVLITALAGLEWFFLIELSRLPGYDGPARAGKTMPAFQTTLANGRAFTDGDLHGDERTLFVFFRGRW